MTTGQLDEIEKLAETWLSKEKDFYATGRDAALHQFILAMREHALPLVKAVREARAEVERLREAVRKVHALVSSEMEWTIERIDYPIQEIHKITKGMVE